MVKENYFTASAELTRRAGIIESRYRTKDGRYVITDKDLQKLSLVMTPQEFIGGIDVVEISEKEAKRLISEGGYHVGELYEKTEEEVITDDKIGSLEQELGVGSSSGDETENEKEEEE